MENVSNTYMLLFYSINIMYKAKAMPKACKSQFCGCENIVYCSVYWDVKVCVVGFFLGSFEVFDRFYLACQ